MSAQPPYDLGEIAPHPSLVQNYGRFPLRFVSGEGCWLVDDQGRRFLDGLAGIATCSLGHGHPALVAAIQRQAATLIHTSNLYHIARQEELAERLCRHSGGQRVFFCNSGTEANEAALKVVRRWGNVTHAGRKPRVIAAEHSFHGRTLGALALTGNPHYHEGFQPLAPIDFVPYGDVAALTAKMGDDVAGVFLEPLQGEGGVRPAPDGYLAAARALCDRHQALLCLDEVQTGVGRCGRMFLHHEAGIRFDCMSLAKGLAGGVPIGAMVTTEALAKLLVPGTHASTFGGNPLACAAGVAVLDELAKPGFLDGVRARGERLMAGLRRVFAGREVRGRGLLVGVVLGRPPRDLVTACLRQGAIVGSAGSDVLRLAPPLIISDAEVDDLVSRIAAAAAATVA